MNPIKISHESSSHANVFVLNWMLGNYCNYSCTYCPTHLHDGTLSWANFEVVKSFIDRIIRHYSTILGKEVYVEFTGGEITYYKDLHRLLSYLDEKGCRIGLISNGSRPVSFWEKIVEKIDHVSISFHPETGDADSFFELVKFLSNKVSTHVNLMMEKANFEKCISLGDRISNSVKNISISYQPLMGLLMQDTNLVSYSKDQMDLIFALEKQINIEWTSKPFTYRGNMRIFYSDGSSEEKTVSELVASRAINWFGWKCNAGLDQLVVNPVGEIYRAWCKQDKLGTIFDDNFAFPLDPAICRTDGCYCNTDILNSREICGSQKIYAIEYIELIKDISISSYTDNIKGGGSFAKIQPSDDAYKVELSVRAGFQFPYAGIFIELNRNNVCNCESVCLEFVSNFRLSLRINFIQHSIHDDDYYGMNVEIVNSSLIKVSLDDVRQLGWGTRKPWNPAEVNSIAIIIANKIGDVSFKIESLKLMMRTT